MHGEVTGGKQNQRREASRRRFGAYGALRESRDHSGDKAAILLPQMSAGAKGEGEQLEPKSDRSGEVKRRGRRPFLVAGDFQSNGSDGGVERELICGQAQRVQREMPSMAESKKRMYSGAWQRRK